MDENNNASGHKRLIVAIIAVFLIYVFIRYKSDKYDNKYQIKDTASYTTESSGANKENSGFAEGDDFEHNSYYDVVDSGAYTTIIGNRIVIMKVKGKKDVSIEATVLVYDKNGAVIEKSTDTIAITEGEYNYFKFQFSCDISNVDSDIKLRIVKDSITAGERSAVQMVTYNKNGDHLYLTLKQVKAKLGGFSQYKLLLYKNGKIVGDEWGYYSVSAKGLNGLNTTDVAEIWVYGEDFDKVEFMFEP